MRLAALGHPSLLPSHSATRSPPPPPIRTTFNCSLQQKEPPPSPPPATSLLHNHPLYTQTHTNLSLSFKEKILCLEILGIDSGKALSLNPSLYSASLDSIHSIITYLHHKGIPQKDLPSIFTTNPQILTSNIQTDLNPVFRFLSSTLSIPNPHLRKVITKCPKLLTSSVKTQLRPTLLYLQNLGFKDLKTLVYNDPVLLVLSVEETLIPKFEFLVGLGFSREEVREMVLKCPGLLTYSVENNYKPKMEFFLGEMKGKLEDLKGFPQFFGFSLEKKIKPRYLESVESGVEMALPDLLDTSDEEFRELISQGMGETSKSNKVTLWSGDGIA